MSNERAARMMAIRRELAAKYETAANDVLIARMATLEYLNEAWHAQLVSDGLTVSDMAEINRHVSANSAQLIELLRLLPEKPLVVQVRYVDDTPVARLRDRGTRPAYDDTEEGRAARAVDKGAMDGEIEAEVAAPRSREAPHGAR